MMQTGQAHGDLESRPRRSDGPWLPGAGLRGAGVASRQLECGVRVGVGIAGPPGLDMSGPRCGCRVVEVRRWFTFRGW